MNDYTETSDGENIIIVCAETGEITITGSTRGNKGFKEQMKTLKGVFGWIEHHQALNEKKNTKRWQNEP